MSKMYDVNAPRHPETEAARKSRERWEATPVEDRLLAEAVVTNALKQKAFIKERIAFYEILSDTELVAYRKKHLQK